MPFPPLPFEIVTMICHELAHIDAKNAIIACFVHHSMPLKFLTMWTQFIPALRYIVNRGSTSLIDRCDKEDGIIRIREIDKQGRVAMQFLLHERIIVSDVIDLQVDSRILPKGVHQVDVLSLTMLHPPERPERRIYSSYTYIRIEDTVFHTRLRQLSILNADQLSLKYFGRMPKLQRIYFFINTLKPIPSFYFDSRVANMEVPFTQSFIDSINTVARSVRKMYFVKIEPKFKHSDQMFIERQGSKTIAECEGKLAVWYTFYCSVKLR